MEIINNREIYEKYRLKGLSQTWEFGELFHIITGIKPTRIKINDEFAVQVRFRPNGIYTEAVVGFNDISLNEEKVKLIFKNMLGLKKFNLVIDTIDIKDKFEFKNRKELPNSIITLTNELKPDKKRRQNIRKAIASGVKIDFAKDEDLMELTHIADEFQKKKDLKKILMTKEVIEYALHSEIAKIFCIRYNNKLLGFEIVLLDKETSTSFSWKAAWNEEALEINGPSLLTWNIIEWSKKEGYTTFDFCGMNFSEKTSNIARFKESFGGLTITTYSYKIVSFLGKELPIKI